MRVSNLLPSGSGRQSSNDSTQVTLVKKKKDRREFELVSVRNKCLKNTVMSEPSSSEFLSRRIDELSKSTFPPPKPPSSRKHEVFKTEDFSDIDEHAESAPENLLDGGVENLLDYLRLPHYTTQLQLLRAIYSWLGNQQLVETVYDRDDVAVDSLEAGLPCKTILGIDKQVYNFPVGDLDVEDNQVWAAVHLDGSWRLVDVSGAFTGVTAPSVPAGCVLIEDSGEAKREWSDEEEVKNTQYRANDFFFLTDPDVFIYFSCPGPSEDPAWQLLKEPWSIERFLTEPRLYVNYFQAAWRMSESEKQTSRKVAIKGKCSVTFVKPNGSEDLKYRLYFDKQRSREEMPEDLQLSRYILTNNDNIDLTQALVTRLPVNGLYLLNIMDESEFKLCSISIEATQVRGQQQFPPGASIFGPTKAAVDMGLVDVSREEGVLVVREGEKIRMRFRSRRSLEVKASLLHNNQPSEDLAERLTVNQKDDEVVIDVKKAERGNDPDVLEAAINAAHQSKVSYALHRAPWFAKAERRLISLRRIATMSKRVLKVQYMSF
ncbi:hypothetical protein C0Q70_18005 [Pomacea canaliculata]|uniref:Transglutaminase-like domain-containing protein n=1 Tax=Pomacea canaliculata TaxID=400727 RepID=A0A2T7NM05_POMCA|nr:hypothetical protein C0Q70_18005 [Pomacea canaliculata]